MTTLSSYYLGMAIVVTIIFSLTLAYQTMRFDNDAKKNKPSEK